MPTSVPDDGTLAWRVAELERRAEDDRSTQAALMDRISRLLHEEYLTSDQIARRYVSREERAASSSGRREWLLVWVAIVATAGTIVQTIGALH